MSERFVQRLALASAALGLKTKTQQAQALGVGRTSLFYYESGGHEQIPEPILQKLEQLEREAANLIEHGVQVATEKEEAPRHGGKKPIQSRIPVIGWAHAGEFGSYEEISKDWQDWVIADVRDDKAFAVRLEGDSMGDFYIPGDVLFLSPSREIYNGCLAVIKLKDDGFIFREVEKRPGLLRLIPWNKQWNQEDLPLAEIAWALPVVGMWREIWKR